MEGARSIKGKSKSRKGRSKTDRLDFTPISDLKDPSVLTKEIVRLEDLMYKHAQDLEFEEAASFRDRVSELKDKLFKN